MAISIKNKYFEEILNEIDKGKIRYDFEGCACGSIDIKLNEQLYLHSYVSCRKSGSTPDHKLWHMHDFEFYTKPYYEYVHPEIHEKVLINLIGEQHETLKSKLKVSIREIWGAEYRDED